MKPNELQRDELDRAGFEIVRQWKQNRHEDIYDGRHSTEFRDAMISEIDWSFFKLIGIDGLQIACDDWLEVYQMDFADDNPRVEYYFPVCRH